MQFLTNLALAALAILPAFGSPVPTAPKAGDIVPDSYIVVLNEGVSQSAFQAHQNWASSVYTASLRKRGLEAPAETFQYTYNFGTLKGYAGTFDKATIDEISSRAEVAYVEANAVVTTQTIVSSTPQITSLVPSPSMVLSSLEQWEMGMSLWDYPLWAVANPINRLHNLPFLHGVLVQSLTSPFLAATTSMIALQDLASLFMLSILVS